MRVSQNPKLWTSSVLQRTQHSNPELLKRPRNIVDRLVCYDFGQEDLGLLWQSRQNLYLPDSIISFITDYPKGGI